MPTYAYRCDSCGATCEFFQSMSEGPKRKCPSCGALKLQRQIGGGAGFIFKGSGFYETDYRSDSYKAGEAADKKSSSDTGGSAEGGADGASGAGKSTGDSGDSD